MGDLLSQKFIWSRGMSISTRKQNHYQPKLSTFNSKLLGFDLLSFFKTPLTKATSAVCWYCFVSILALILLLHK